jgi:hypothetical protein
MISKGSLVRVHTGVFATPHAAYDVWGRHGEYVEKPFLVVTDPWKNSWGQTLVKVQIGNEAWQVVTDNLQLLSQ